MVSGWHVTHLPVREVGRERTWRVVDEVIVAWEELVVDGFLLSSGPFRASYLSGTSDTRVTAMGIEILSRQCVERRTRRWRKDVLRRQQAMKNRTVVDQTGRIRGRIKDFLFDEKTLAITHLVVSRGVVGDLLSGAYMVSVKQLTDMVGETIKIYVAGEP